MTINFEVIYLFIIHLMTLSVTQAVYSQNLDDNKLQKK
jgi:hypothetical protein